MKCDTSNRCTAGTLVERTTRLLKVVKLPHLQPATAAHVLQAISDKLNDNAQPMRLSLTYDRDKEMARHRELTANGCGGVLLRSEQPVAAQHQREHQWPDSPVPA